MGWRSNIVTAAVRVAAGAWVQPLVWEPLHAIGGAPQISRVAYGSAQWPRYSLGLGGRAVFKINRVVHADESF